MIVRACSNTHSASSSWGRRLVAALTAASIVLPIATPALAWKPKTHVYLAELAMRDAIDDGKVTIYQTDYATGRVLGPLGSFEANPAIVAALRARPAQYLAGVVGPDGYPDLMTGQQIVHPGTSLSLLGDPARNEPASTSGADAWLTYLWRLAYGRRDPNVERIRGVLNSTPLGEVAPPNDTPEIRAFVAGYLTHAAGDMFMHTFVNHYAGGDFAIQPDPRNAIKHVVLEGYVGKRTPDTHAAVSIAGVDDFIYRYMVRAWPGSVLEQRLLQGAGTSTSLPSIFSTLRNGLQRDVDAYDRERLSRSGPSRVAYAAANGPIAEYKKAWIEDIDNGLRAWPGVSHQIALALVYNPNSDGADVTRAKAVASAYVGDHLLSMAGAPDAVVATAQFISSVIDAILPDFMLAPFAALKRALLEWLVKEATGMSVDELKGYLSNPEQYFDRVMNGPGGGYGGRSDTRTTLAAFNRDVLQINDPGTQFMDRKFEVDRFAPAFNTLQMTKLMFLSEKGMNDLLAALRAKGLTVPSAPGVAGSYENAFLGFLTSLDGDNRWQGLAPGSSATRGRPFFLASGGADGWRNLFMRQIGERADWPAGTAPAATQAGPADDTGFQTIEWWGARVDDVRYDGAAGRSVVITMTFRNDGSQPRTFSDQLVKPVRAVLGLGASATEPLARMEYVNTEEAKLPAWHYLPTGSIPRQGRIQVRFIFDVGDAARQREVDRIVIYEQRPRSAMTPLNMVDGPSKSFALTRMPADPPAPAPPPTAEWPAPPPVPFVRSGVQAFPGALDFSALGPLRVRNDRIVYGSANPTPRTGAGLISLDFTLQNITQAALRLKPSDLKATVEQDGVGVVINTYSPHVSFAGKGYAEETVVEIPAGGVFQASVAVYLADADAQRRARFANLIYAPAGGPERTFRFSMPPFTAGQQTQTPAPAPPPPPPPTYNPPPSPAPNPGQEQAMRALEGTWLGTLPGVMTLRYEAGLLRGEIRLTENQPPVTTMTLTMNAQGRLVGVMKREDQAPQVSWFTPELTISPDGSALDGQAAYVHMTSNSPMPMRARRQRPAPPPQPAPAPGPGSAAPLRLGAYEVAFVSTQKGQGGDWETIWSLTNRSQVVTEVRLNDLAATLIDASGATAEGTAPYYYAEETGRRVRPSGFQIAPGETTRVRLAHTGSGGLTPVRYRIRVRDAQGEGSLQGGSPTSAGAPDSTFAATPYLSLRVDAVSRSPRNPAQLEVAVTERNVAGGRKSVQQAPYTFVLVAANGAEYRWDGNFYGESGAEHLLNTLWLEKDEQGRATYVFPGVPQSVQPERLSVRENGREVVGLSLSGAPAQRPRETASAGSGGNAASTQGRFTVVMDRLQRAEDGEWEAILSVGNPGGSNQALRVNDFDVVLYGDDGQARHRYGDYYQPDAAGRFPIRDSMVVAPGSQIRLRIYFPQSAGMTPVRYRVQEAGGSTTERPVP